MRIAWFIVLAVSSIVFSGCKSEDPITVYRIPKEVSGLDGVRSTGSHKARPAAPNSAGPANVSSAPQAGQATRMVVALFQRQTAAWFFKITGSPEDVSAAQPKWKPFIDEVKFAQSGNAEEPQWKLPEGWTTGPPAPFRFATIKLPDSDLEIRVSKLGGQQDLLSNVNRWRASQLGLPAATAGNIDDQFKKQTGQGGEYLLFDQQGTSTGQSMGGPFMNRASRPPASAQPPNKPAPPQASTRKAAAPEFDLTPPEGFKLGKTSPMVVARFVKETEAGTIQISVVPLTAINNWNDNVNFWRQSVGLEKMTDTEITQASQAITISGIDGNRIDLLDESETAEKGLVGVMVKKGELAWFFKMMGPRAGVQEHTETFAKFLNSFKFKK